MRPLDRRHGVACIVGVLLMTLGWWNSPNEPPGLFALGLLGFALAAWGCGWAGQRRPARDRDGGTR